MTAAPGLMVMGLLLAAGVPPARGGVDAVVLPIRATAPALPDVGPVTLLVEDAFAAAFTRHHGAPVLTAAELRGTLSREAQAQLAGCDANTCFQEVLDALDAPHVVLLNLDVSPGLWTLTAAVANRKSGEVLRRREIRSRTLEALLDSLDTMCRSLEGAPALDVEDPQLAQRLSTDSRGVVALRKDLQAHPGADPIAAWTGVVTRINQENRMLDLAAGGMFAGAGLLALLAATLHGVANGVGSVAYTQQVDPPVLWAVVPALVVLALLAGAVTLAAAAWVLLVVDMLDLGRVPVGKNGCCRDEARVRHAGQTHPLAWVAVGLGAAGLTAATVSFPLAVLAFWSALFAWDSLRLNTLDVAPPPGTHRYFLVGSGAWVAFSFLPVGALVLAPLVVAITAGLLWLVRDSAHPVVDDQAPVAAPTAGQRVRVAN